MNVIVINFKDHGSETFYDVTSFRIVNNQISIEHGLNKIYNCTLDLITDIKAA